MKNKKGFTLVELVVTIAIIGVVSLITIPSVQILKNKNEVKKYEYYEQVLIEAAKVYVDKHKLVSVSGKGGCELIPIEALKKDNLVKDFKSDSFDCETGTYVRVERKNKKYKYLPVMKCVDSDNKIYKSNNYDKNIVSSTCVAYKGDEYNPEYAKEGNYVEKIYKDNPDTMTDSDPDGNIRYMGSNPNNYVWFNNERWRIIGSFKDVDDGTGKKETRLKIVRDESIGSYSWDVSEGVVNSYYGVNEWSQADLMILLNSGPYWNRTDGVCYNGFWMSTEECKFSNNGLTSDAKDLIADAVWHTGTINGDWFNAPVSAFYPAERSDNIGKTCTGGDLCNDTVERKTTWTGKVGLIYPSDYGYATSGGSADVRDYCLNSISLLDDWVGARGNDCKSNDWLYTDVTNNQWTITPLIDERNASRVVKVACPWRYSNDPYSSLNNFGVKPVVYLKFGVDIVKDSGDGSFDHPYQLELK